MQLLELTVTLTESNCFEVQYLSVAMQFHVNAECDTGQLPNITNKQKKLENPKPQNAPFAVIYFECDYISFRQIFPRGKKYLTEIKYKWPNFFLYFIMKEKNIVKVSCSACDLYLLLG